MLEKLRVGLCGQSTEGEEGKKWVKIRVRRLRELGSAWGMLAFVGGVCCVGNGLEGNSEME